MDVVIVGTFGTREEENGIGVVSGELSGGFVRVMEGVWRSQSRV